MKPEPKEPIVPLAEVEKRSILAALEQTNGNVWEAARLLGIGKTTLYRKLRYWRMKEEESKQQADIEMGPPSIDLAAQERRLELAQRLLHRELIERRVLLLE